MESYKEQKRERTKFWRLVGYLIAVFCVFYIAGLAGEGEWFFRFLQVAAGILGYYLWDGYR